MMKSFFPPKRGEQIALMCTKCNCMFFGSNPGDGLFRLFSKTKCPDCGGKEVIPHPLVHY